MSLPVSIVILELGDTVGWILTICLTGSKFLIVPVPPLVIVVPTEIVPVMFFTIAWTLGKICLPVESFANPVDKLIPISLTEPILFVFAIIFAPEPPVEVTVTAGRAE